VQISDRSGGEDRLISVHFGAAGDDFFGGRCARLRQGFVAARPWRMASPKLFERRRAVTAA
jgi:hypothetical protein